MLGPRLFLVLIVGSFLVEGNSENLAGAESPEIKEDNTTMVGSRAEQFNDTELSDKEVGAEIVNDQNQKTNDEGLQISLTDDTEEMTTFKPEDDQMAYLPPCSEKKPSWKKHSKRKNRRHKTMPRRQKSFEEEDSTDDGDENKVESLNRYNCMNAVHAEKLSHMCCHPQSWDNDMKYCAENVDTTDIDFESNSSEREASLRLIECFYEKKQYLKSKDKLDMDKIIADASKLNDTQRADFIVNMYSTCERLAKESAKEFKRKRSELKKNFSSSHEVFMFVLFSCYEEYFKTNSCPYFYWRGTCLEVNKDCMSYAKECKAIMGH